MPSRRAVALATLACFTVSAFPAQAKKPATPAKKDVAAQFDAGVAAAPQAAADAGTPSAVAAVKAAAPSAPNTPTAAEAKKVIDYYYNGKAQGPVLVELKACARLDTGKDSPHRNECVEEVKGPVKKGTNVHAWTMWLVPDGGDYEDATIQFLYEDQVRSTMDIRLTTALRSRTFRANTVSRSGKWWIKVFRAGTELASVPFTVVD